jgi:MFS family permease
MLFVSTALTFWTTDYLTNVMNFNESVVNYSFIIVSVTAPATGMIVGGILVQKMCGGYEKKSAILFVCISLILSCVFIIPIYLFNNLLPICVCLFGILLFGGAAIPTIQGITICSVSHDLRASGNSVCNLIIYILGFSGGPFIYGLLYDTLKNKDKKLPFLLTLSFGFIGLFFSIIGAVLKYKKYFNNFEKEKEIFLEEEQRSRNNENKLIDKILK